MAYFLLIHALGFSGGTVLRKLRVPAGVLLGAMAGVILLNLLSGQEYAYAYPTSVRIGVQVLSGIVIGRGVAKGDLVHLRYMLKPALIMVSMLIGFNVLFAFIISHLTILTPITALFAAAPGGVADFALIAVDFGADTQQVAILQIFRFAFVVAFFPIAVRRILSRMSPARAQDGEEPSSAPVCRPQPQPITNARSKVLGAVLTLGAGISGAVIARGLGVPAGAIIGALSGVVILNCLTHKAYFPIQARVAAQVGAGCYIGSQITLQSVHFLRFMLVPMALVIIQVLLMAFVTSWVLCRVTKIDYPTSLFSCVPGGIAEMGIIAEEMGLRVPQIIMLHTCRLIVVIAMMPLLLHLFAR